MDLDAVAHLHFLDMTRGQDWDHLPAPYADNPEHLWAVAMRAAGATVRSRIMLDTINQGPGNSTDNLTLLLAQMWTAGFKTGFTQASKNIEKED